MTHISLFSGIGGIDLAAEWAGFETLECVEINPFCQKVLAKNFPGAKIHSDVTTYHPGFSPTLISAGFPCQPHSLAGKRKASLDERDLWGEVVRVVGEAQPRWFLGENVPGLLTSERGRFFGRVVDDLAQMGYRVGWGVWGAKDIGAVHKRNRVFIVAYSEHSGCGRFAGRTAPQPSRNQQNDRVFMRDDPADVAYSEKLLGDERNNQPESEIPKPRYSDCEGLLSDFCRERSVCHNPNKCDGNNCWLKKYTERSSNARNSYVARLEGAGQKGSASDSTAANPDSLSGLQTLAPPCSIGEKRDTWDDALRSLGRGDWKAWCIEPVIRADDDGLPAWMVRNRVEIMKALGNAVVPHQVYPLLKEIANYEIGLKSYR